MINDEKNNFLLDGEKKLIETLIKLPIACRLKGIKNGYLIMIIYLTSIYV